MGTVDAVGTVRRVRALMAMGWDTWHIGQAANRPASVVGTLLDLQVVSEETAEAIRHAYDQLCMSVGPAKDVMEHARGMGWAPPLAWDEDEIDDPDARPKGLAQTDPALIDEVVVQRLMDGCSTKSTRAERMEAARRLHALGRTAKQISDAVGVSRRAIARYLSEQRPAEAAA